ncbi:MAG: GHKL domain-containing protein [Lachnospiraceae bacterium]|nr:GHKL domain-containing protein [Lachnospiraceae bacterium]
MYEAAELIMTVIRYLFDGYCLCLLFREFMKPKIRQRTWHSFLAVMVWFIIKMAVRCAAYANPQIVLEMEIQYFVFKLLVIYFIGALFYQGRQSTKVFAALLFVALDSIFNQIGYAVMLFWNYGAGKLSGVMYNAAIMRTTVKLIDLLAEVTIETLLYLSVKIIIKNHRRSIDGNNTKETIFYTLPVFMGALTAVIFRFIIAVINKEHHLVYYDNYIEIYLFITLISVVIWLVILYSFKLQQEIAGLQEERTQKKVLENQISQMENSMLEMERFYESVSHVKHDMKNQMAVMEKLLRERQITEKEEVTGYFEDMQKTLMNLEQKIHTGNVVSDAVIGNKFYYAAKELKGIHLEADGFLLTDKVHVRAYDIGVILNNGLDNAIEACRKARLKNQDQELYIKIKSFWKQKMFFIEIENSFDGEVKWGKDGYPCSAKDDGRIHGIGLKNIRYCALKYGGDMDCIAEKGRFILSVMLKG